MQRALGAESDIQRQWHGVALIDDYAHGFDAF